MEAVPGARRRSHRTTDFRHRVATHRHHDLAPPAGCGPRHQGLHLLLADFPQPRPPRETWDSNPWYRQLDTQFTQHHRENPDYTGLHFMAAYELEDCWQLLRHSLHSVSYETLAHLTRYSTVVVAAGLDAVLPVAPSQPETRRSQRRRKALGAQESQPPLRAGCVAGHLSRRVGDPDPSAGGDHSGIDVLAAQHTAEGLSTTFHGALLIPAAQLVNSTVFLDQQWGGCRSGSCASRSRRLAGNPC